MATLRAETKTIEEIFQREYLIPDYQRPYSWGKDQCQQLWDDLVAFHDEEDESDEQYFLGCIVIIPTIIPRRAKPPQCIVVDGQQRLTTLLLLIRALHKKAGTYRALEECYRKPDPRTGKFNGDLRLQYEVTEGDGESFAAVLKGEHSHRTKNSFSENLDRMVGWLDGHESFKTSDSLEQFIKTLLHRVVLLPIECDKQDSALQIFNTLNNRGLPLTDADIFRATLYKKSLATGHKEKFVNDWRDLMDNDGQNDYDVERLFRIHMHVLRAQEGVTGNEGKLRAYFEKRGRLDEPQAIVECLTKYKAVDIWKRIPEIDVIWWDWWNNIWWCILLTLPGKVYWHYPLYVFLDKHGDYNDKEGEFALSTQKEAEFIKLLEATVRYCFIMGVATKTVNSIKPTIFSVCKAIARGEDYDDLYCKNSQDSVPVFKGKLTNCDYGSYRTGLVLIGGALHHAQVDTENRADYAKLISGKYQIEHILPHKWNHYDGWTEEEYGKDLNKLGNLIPLERKLNIKASNEFFARKQEVYKKSKNPEARRLGEGEYGDRWLPETLQKRHEELLKLLEKFFDPQNDPKIDPNKKPPKKP
ncbi:MAG: DUF262 domain-containing HNH endonuclease family protein [Nitrospira sp.]|nr:DUF262 domain-containing HNH endonuclease family protein [Nitrospira sp.]